MHPQSAAARAGLQPGDVLTHVGGVEVFDAPGLNLRLQLEPLGRSVELGVARRGSALSLRLPLEPPPGDAEPVIRRLSGNHPLNGAAVAELSPAFNEVLGIDLFTTGVGVVEVEPRSFATRLRLQRGDVVAALNGQRIGDLATLERALAAGTQRWTVSIERGGQLFDLTIG